MTRSSTRSSRTTAAGRTLLVLFFCAGIAFLGLLSGGDYPDARARRGFGDPMAGYFPEEMPRYPGSRAAPAGAEELVGGNRVRMAHFTTGDEPAKVARFYDNYWSQRRLFVTKDVTHVGGVVSAVAADGGRVFQVLMVRRGDKTAVFPSVSEAPLTGVGQQGHQPVVPLLPGSRAVITLGSREGNTRAWTTLSLNDGSMQENLTHYRHELLAAGYRPEISRKPPELADNQEILLFRSDDGEVTVNLTALGERRVRVHLMEVSSR
jgi:hypothetical protein